MEENKKVDKEKALEYIKKDENAKKYVAHLMDASLFISIAILIWFGAELVTDISASEIDWGFIVIDAIFTILVLIDLIKGLMFVRNFRK